LRCLKLIRSVKEMQEAAATAKRAGRRIALVPTMGALHEGHVALMRRARGTGAAVAVSIYVNPTQFGPSEDFKKYPRTLEADLDICRQESVDFVFAPDDVEMYPGGDSSTWVTETALSRRLEGERRPDFFRGVCTVVSKLFNIVQPAFAVFGEKDFQQLRVVQRMVRDLRYPIEILSVPTVREADGLAFSSRNRCLTAEERAQATVLNKALNIARDLSNDGERKAQQLRGAMSRVIQLAPAARVDYTEVVDAETFQPVTVAQRGNVALVAAFIGRTRLIDNLIL
jgi:pantoate--beta-alanine ligase